MRRHYYERLEVTGTELVAAFDPSARDEPRAGGGAFGEGRHHRGQPKAAAIPPKVVCSLGRGLDANLTRPQVIKDKSGKLAAFQCPRPFSG
jgi:hypothetical protein